MDSEIDSYEILNQLAKGGQGITSRARRKTDNALVVLKDCFCDSSKAGNSALQEAKTLQSLKHPHVIRYEDVFLSEKGGSLVVCTVMEYCDGGDLARYLIALKKHNMPIAPKRVVGWARQLASAVAYLHQNKVLHRDLKPQNVFMSTEDSLRIGDFGLAQTMERGKRTSQVGTPCYMAPEVLQHDAYADSVDVWGVGCIILEAMTLEFLWERKGMLAAHVLSDPIIPRKLPTEYPAFIREATAACLAATPQRRPDSSVLCQMLVGGADQNGNAMAGLGQLFENIQSSASEALSNLFNPQQQMLGGASEYSPPAEPHERAILSLTGRSITASVAQSHAPPSQATARPHAGVPAAGASTRLQALPESSAEQLLGAPSASSFRTTQAPSNAAPPSALSSRPFLPPSLSKAPAPPLSEHSPTSRAHSAANRPSLSPSDSPLSLHPPSSKPLPPSGKMLSMPVGGTGGGVLGSSSNVAMLQQLTAQLANVSEEAPAPPEPPRPQLPASSPPAPRQPPVKHSPTASGKTAAPSGEGEGEEGERMPQAGGGSFRGGVQDTGEAGEPKARLGPMVEGGEIPSEVVDAYLDGGLFAVEPQWRGVVQRAVQKRQMEKVQDKLQSVDLRDGKKGARKSEGGVWSTLSKSLSFGSKGSKGGAPPSAAGEKRWGKKLLVEKANKQYELLYELAEWEQAREATARVTAIDASGKFQKEYAADEDIEAEYKRRFGPPKSRFIGSSEKLMVV